MVTLVVGDSFDSLKEKPYIDIDSTYSNYESKYQRVKSFIQDEITRVLKIYNNMGVDVRPFIRIYDSRDETVTLSVKNDKLLNKALRKLFIDLEHKTDLKYETCIAKNTNVGVKVKFTITRGMSKENHLRVYEIVYRLRNTQIDSPTEKHTLMLVDETGQKEILDVLKIVDSYSSNNERLFKAISQGLIFENHFAEDETKSKKDYVNEGLEGLLIPNTSNLVLHKHEVSEININGKDFIKLNKKVDTVEVVSEHYLYKNYIKDKEIMYCPKIDCYIFVDSSRKVLYKNKKKWGIENVKQ